MHRAALMLKRAVEAKGIAVRAAGADRAHRRRAAGSRRSSCATAARSPPTPSSSRSASAPISRWRGRPARRSIAASWSTTICETSAAGVHAHRRMRRASRLLLRPGGARLRAGAAFWRGVSPASARAIPAACSPPISRSPASTCSPPATSSARRRGGGDRAQRSRRRHLQEAGHRATVASSARCCSAIPPTRLWYLDLIRTRLARRAHSRRSRVRARARDPRGGVTGRA